MNRRCSDWWGLGGLFELVKQRRQLSAERATSYPISEILHYSLNDHTDRRSQHSVYTVANDPRLGIRVGIFGMAEHYERNAVSQRLLNGRARLRALIEGFFHFAADRLGVAIKQTVVNATASPATRATEEPADGTASNDRTSDTQKRLLSRPLLE